MRFAVFLCYCVRSLYVFPCGFAVFVPPYAPLLVSRPKVLVSFAAARDYGPSSWEGAYQSLNFMYHVILITSRYMCSTSAHPYGNPLKSVWRCISNYQKYRQQYQKKSLMVSTIIQVRFSQEAAAVLYPIRLVWGFLKLRKVEFQALHLSRRCASRDLTNQNALFVEWFSRLERAVFRVV